MSNVWFTSDLHIGHAKIALIRGNTINPAGHDSVLATCWDDLVAKDDVVWVLGDISAGGSNAQRNALEWLSCRPGRKRLIAGNHDGVHPMHRDAHRWMLPYHAVFESVASSARIRVAGREVVLSHFPYDGDHTVEQRYDQWRLRDLGTPILHGHTHSSQPVSLSAAGTRQVHVGVDAWNKGPVGIDTVAWILDRTVA